MAQQLSGAPRVRGALLWAAVQELHSSPGVFDKSHFTRELSQRDSVPL